MEYMPAILNDIDSTQCQQLLSPGEVVLIKWFDDSYQTIEFIINVEQYEQENFVKVWTLCHSDKQIKSLMVSKIHNLSSFKIAKVCSV